MASSYSYQVGERQLIYHRNQVFTSMDALLLHLKNKGFTSEMIGKILDRIQPTTEVIMKQYLRDAGYSLADVNNLMTPPTKKTTKVKKTEEPKQAKTEVTQSLPDNASSEKKPAAATTKKKTTTKTTRKSAGRKKSSAKKKTSAATK